MSAITPPPHQILYSHKSINLESSFLWKGKNRKVSSCLLVQLQSVYIYARPLLGEVNHVWYIMQGKGFEYFSLGKIAILVTVIRCQLLE